MKATLPKIATPEQSTSEALRLRALMLLAAQNGKGNGKAAVK
jgi:hypothetical protein